MKLIELTFRGFLETTENSNLFNYRLHRGFLEIGNDRYHNQLPSYWDKLNHKQDKRD